MLLLVKMRKKNQRLTDLPRLETRFLEIQLNVFSKDPPPLLKMIPSHQINVCSFLQNISALNNLVVFLFST